MSVRALLDMTSTSTRCSSHEAYRNRRRRYQYRCRLACRRQSRSRASRRATTADVTGGIVAAFEALKAVADFGSGIDALMIGTTHFVNAVVQRRHLTKVAAIRVALPAAAGAAAVHGLAGRSRRACQWRLSGRSKAAMTMTDGGSCRWTWRRRVPLRVKSASGG